MLDDAERVQSVFLELPREVSMLMDDAVRLQMLRRQTSPPPPTTPADWPRLPPWSGCGRWGASRAPPSRSPSLDRAGKSGASLALLLDLDGATAGPESREFAELPADP